MSSVSVNKLMISLGQLPILTGLDLEVGDGEFLVLLGPSGCGKSTLLNAIAGLLDVDDGEIRIGDRDVTWLEPKDRKIGMVFQSYALFPRMTVRENLSFGLRMAGVRKAEIATRVASAADILQMGALLDRKPSELSGGQRQRVAIGRALVRDVDVYLFDEPLSNLDAKLRTELRVELKKLHQRLGSTMIYVTHDQIEAMTLADRVAVMRNGSIQQLGTPQEIYNRPRNLYVAGFVGSPSMNFLRGVLQWQDGRPRVELEGGVVINLVGYDFGTADQSGGRRVVLGVRPEQFTLQQDVQEGTGLPMTVTLVDPLGADNLVWATAGATTISVRVSGKQTYPAGALLNATFDPRDVSLFDAESGDRI